MEKPAHTPDTPHVQPLSCKLEWINHKHFYCFLLKPIRDNLAPGSPELLISPLYMRRRTLGRDWVTPNLKKALRTGKIGFYRKCFSPIYAMFSQYRMAIALARKPYGIGLLFRTHKNGDFGEISVTERSCSAPNTPPKGVTQPIRYVTLHYRK